MRGERMPIKDAFSYSARWGSVGLNCHHCQHFSGPEKWPDDKKVLKCMLHNISLKIELSESGYVEYEWFCKDFQDIGTANEGAVKHFEKIKHSLKSEILYRLYGEDGNLVEYDMGKL